MNRMFRSDPITVDDQVAAEGENADKPEMISETVLLADFFG